MKEEEIKKLEWEFSQLSKTDKVTIAAQECGKLLIAVMIDVGIDNYINTTMKDDKGTEYQLVFVRKPNIVPEIK